MDFSDLRQHTGENLEPQVLLVAETVGAPLDDADLVVEAFHEAERNLVLGLAVRRYAVPVTLDHRRELLVGRQPLPFEGIAPVVEKPARPTFVLVAPQLAERLLEQIGRVESLVGLEQQPEADPAAVIEVFSIRQQSVFLPLDEAPPAVLVCQPGVLAPAYLVERLAQVPHNVELVVHDGGLRGVALGGIGKSLPHVHDGEPDARAALGPQLDEELVQAFLFAVFSPEPDRTLAYKVADNDPIFVPFAYRDLVEADHLQVLRRWHAPKLLAHVLHLQRFDGAPVEVQFLGHVLDGRCPAAPTNIEREAFGVERIVGQEGQLLLLYGAATPAADSPYLHLQVHAGIAARLVSHASSFAVVPASMHATAAPACCFFERRLRVMTRATGSPKTPLTVELGRKPGNRYSSHNRRCRLLIRIAA
jgi:hypothetical protein